MHSSKQKTPATTLRHYVRRLLPVATLSGLALLVPSAESAISTATAQSRHAAERFVLVHEDVAALQEAQASQGVRTPREALRSFPPAAHSTAPEAAITRYAHLLSDTTLRAGRDTYCARAHPDRSFGDEGLLWVGDRSGYGAVRALLWFEVSELAPEEAIVDAELKLRLRHTEPTWDPARRIVLRRVEESWAESDATWGSFPDYRDDEVSSAEVATPSQWYGWDVTELVQRWRWPDRPWYDWHCDNHGVMLQGYEALGSSRGFDSSESSDEPELAIRHTTDRTAPNGSLGRIPLYHNTEDPAVPGTTLIRLRWSGDDPSPATGVDHFVLAAQRNREAWWFSQPIRESSGGLFRGENGKRFGFRVQAVDVAGNREPDTAAEQQTLVDLSPPRSMVQPIPEFVPGDFVVTWAGYDEPTGEDIFASGITNYTVHYSINGGGWGTLWRDTSDVSRLFEPRQGMRYAFQATACDRAGNCELLGGPEATTHVDGRAPVTRFERVTGVDNQVFTVEWRGWDPGGSGVVSFDVQVRRDLGPWEDWAIGVPASAKSYSGEYSHVYGFRARAHDRAGNTGRYPSQPQLNVGVIDRGILRHEVRFPLVLQASATGGHAR